MNHPLKIFSTLILVAIQTVLTAQQWIGPKPKMTHNLMKSFIETHLEYPEQSLQNKEEGTVIIGFATDENGDVEERHILQSVSPLVDSSALQLFDLILWSPAKKYGKAVECRVSEDNGFPIKYNIRKYGKLVKKRGYDRLPKPFSPVSPDNKIYSKTRLDKLPVVILDSAFKSLNDYIYTQITYPDEASRFNITGIVRLSIIIEKSGLISNIIVMETVGGGCTEEAVDVIKNVKWVPGIKNGYAVRTKCELSITFENPAKLKDKHIPNQQGSGI